MKKVIIPVSIEVELTKNSIPASAMTKIKDIILEEVNKNNLKAQINEALESYNITCNGLEWMNQTGMPSLFNAFTDSFFSGDDFITPGDYVEKISWVFKDDDINKGIDKVSLDVFGLDENAEKKMDTETKDKLLKVEDEWYNTLFTTKSKEIPNEKKMEAIAALINLLDDNELYKQETTFSRTGRISGMQFKLKSSIKRKWKNRNKITIGAF